MKRKLQRDKVGPNSGKGVCRHGACGAVQARVAFLPATKFPTAGAHAEAKQRYTRDAKSVRAEGAGGGRPALHSWLRWQRLVGAIKGGEGSG
jgi:hypothetical protein